MITVVGFPRSGTNFLNRMLAHYVDGPDAAVWLGTPAHPHVNKIHWAYQDKGSSTLAYIYRDPRDCALSGRDYIERHFTRGCPLGLMTFLETYFAGNWELWPCGWRDHTRYWLDRDVATVRYETLCADRARTLAALVGQLGLELDEGRLAHAVVQSYCFGEHHAGGRCVGRAGRWVTDLPREAAAWLDDYCGDIMEQLGYE